MCAGCARPQELCSAALMYLMALEKPSFSEREWEVLEPLVVQSVAGSRAALTAAATTWLLLRVPEMVRASPLRNSVQFKHYPLLTPQLHHHQDRIFHNRSGAFGALCEALPNDWMALLLDA
eukprot:3236477-Pyramimonas_sp.AAC.1